MLTAGCGTLPWEASSATPPRAVWLRNCTTGESSTFPKQKRHGGPATPRQDGGRACALKCSTGRLAQACWCSMVVSQGLPAFRSTQHHPHPFQSSALPCACVHLLSAQLALPALTAAGCQSLPRTWQVEFAKPLTQAPDGQVVEGRPCAEQVPHCDVCITPKGSDHPLCLACTPPYVADGRGKQKHALSSLSLCSCRVLTHGVLACIHVLLQALAVLLRRRLPAGDGSD